MVEKKEKGIPYTIKLKIYQMVDDGKKPRKIHQKLLEEFRSECPEYPDVRNSIYYYRKT